MKAYARKLRVARAIRHAFTRRRSESLDQVLSTESLPTTEELRSFSCTETWYHSDAVFAGNFAAGIRTTANPPLSPAPPLTAPRAQSTMLAVVVEEDESSQ